MNQKDGDNIEWENMESLGRREPISLVEIWKNTIVVREETQARCSVQRKTEDSTPAKLPDLSSIWAKRGFSARALRLGIISFFSLVFKRRATGEKAVSSAHRESAKSALFL